MLVPGVDPVHYTYDAKGRLTEVSQGLPGSRFRRTQYLYDLVNDDARQGYLNEVKDPYDRSVHVRHDDLGRVSKVILPDAREVAASYDGNGNLASLTPPSRPAHTFDYDPANQLTAYTPPEPGAPPAPLPETATRYAYNQDHQLLSLTRPDGQVVSFGYEPGGRLATVTTPRGVVTPSYDPIRAPAVDQRPEQHLGHRRQHPGLRLPRLPGRAGHLGR